jgi:hypothetical protein
MRSRVGLLLIALGVVPSAHAAVLCANSASSLQTHLTTAATNLANDEVRIVMGVHIGQFVYSMSQNFNLVVSGGWNAGCTVQTPGAGSTVLDGNNANRVMLLSGGAGSGAMTVRNLTIRNGNSIAISGSGGGLSIGGSAGFSGNLTLDTVVLRDNDSGSFGGGAIISSGTGSLTMRNCVVTGNHAVSNHGALSVTVSGTSAVFTNNTITFNTTDASTSPVGGVRVASSAAHTFSNNILWGNEGFDLWMPGVSALAVNNDIGMVSGTPFIAGSADNQNTDPLFHDVNDWRLRAESPLVDAGLDTPVGGLPATDAAGLARSVGAAVDVGAHVSTDAIYSDGFQ